MAGFIPPFDLGQFTPSAAAISSWLYQIWKYLQDNPIQSGETIQTEITETVTEVVPGAVADYIEENPVDVPVLSVNGMIGAVVLAYNNLVQDGSTLPIYRAATGETSNNDLLEAWAEGCRFLLVDDTTPYMMVKNVNQGAEVINLVPLSGGGGGGGGDVSSVNGRTGAVVLTYTDFVGVTSTIPVLLAYNDEISNNDLITAWNQGYRFAVVDGTDPYIIMRSGNTATLLPIGMPVSSVNGQTGAVVLDYTDFVGPSSDIPVLHSNTVPSAADLLTAWNAGYRILLVNNTADGTFDLYILEKSGQTVTAIPAGGGGGSGSYTVEKLWENADPSSSFAAQTITLTSSTLNFDSIIVLFSNYKVDSSNPPLYTPPIWFEPSTTPVQLAANSRRIGGTESLVRRATINGAQIAFESNLKNTSADNAFMIPLAVYGITY